jgi:hypothetical protein
MSLPVPWRPRPQGPSRIEPPTIDGTCESRFIIRYDGPMNAPKKRSHALLEL